MYNGLFLTHSSLRYLVLTALIAVIITSLLGLVNRKPFTNLDNKLSLFLLIFTHIQFVVGLTLYFISPWVKFGPDTMKEKFTRYWTVEHIFAMTLAVVLITIARTTSKRMTDDPSKHKRLFIFNLLALVIIVVSIWLSGRGLLSITPSI
jgi:hypothetical protein